MTKISRSTSNHITHKISQGEVMKIHALFFVSLLLVTILSVAEAQILHTLSYQDVLTDSWGIQNWMGLIR